MLLANSVHHRPVQRQGTAPQARSLALSVRCSASTSSSAEPKLNIIPQSAWANGIPPVMGGHLMASGTPAPISTSSGAGKGVAVHLYQYPDKEGDMSVVLNTSPAAAATTLANAVADAAEAAIKAKGAFTLVLSGGSLLTSLGELSKKKGVQWDKWHVFFADERVVPLSSADSNYRAAQEAFLSKVPIPAAQVHAIHEGLNARDAAVNYEGRLLGLPQAALPRTAGGMPVFDVVLLGVGPDGHVASLFPNSPQLGAKSGWVVPVEQSPKPPAQRITLTLPVINAAKDVMIVALGDGKAEIVQRVIEHQSLPGALPAQLVRPTAGKLRWVLDIASAQHLNIAGWEDSKLWPRSQ